MIAALYSISSCLLAWTFRFIIIQHDFYLYPRKRKEEKVLREKEEEFHACYL